MADRFHSIAYLVGARPNFVKMAPVIAQLRRRGAVEDHVLINAGQHYDHLMSAIFTDELQLPPADYSLDVGSGTHAQQTARVMERIEPVLVKERPGLLIVSGDVNATLGAALVAAKMSIPLAHVESGLRSFDRSMPEEINRIVADEFSDYLFLHSEEAIDNLRHQGIPAERMHFVGNTMIDTLVALEERFRGLGTCHRFGLRPRDYLLVTLHRPALVDGQLLKVALHRLEEVARTLPVVFPMHPRTQSRIGPRSDSSRIILTEPLGYLDFVSLEADAAAVLTDSGGVQEETTYLGIPCFTLRDTTERPVTIRAGTNTLLGLDPDRILEIPEALQRRSSNPPSPPPLWDGRAAERVADILSGSRVLEPAEEPHERSR